MYAYNESTAPNPDPRRGGLRGRARRRDAPGQGRPGTPLGARPREHAKGAAATVVDLAGIYVHAKMMIVDDVFVGIGSANLNRRGLYHDGEINVFSVPQRLKAARDNPVAALRRRLWAEMLDLPLATAGPLLEDPLAAARLFDRSPFAGNRFTDYRRPPDAPDVRRHGRRRARADPAAARARSTSSSSSTSASSSTRSSTRRARSRSA